MKTSLARKFVIGLVLAVALPATAMAQSISQAAPGSPSTDNPQYIGDVPEGSTSITQSLSNTIDDFLVCAGTGTPFNTDNSTLRRFFLETDHGITEPFSVNSIDLSIHTAIDGGAGPCAGNPVTINVWSIASGDALTFGNMSLVETVNVQVAPANLSILNVPLPDPGAVDPSTDDLVLEVLSCDHNSNGSGGTFRVGMNSGGQTQPTYLAAPDCGISEPVTTGAIGFPNSHFVLTVYGEQVGGGEPIANFAVNKNFDDDNEASVEVTISCNTGLPLEQTTTIEEGDGVVFVVKDFEDGEMDCSITESVPTGYEASYFDGAATSPDSCEFTAIGFSSSQTCNITNTLQPSEIEVTKEWIDENPEFDAINIAEALWSCSNISDVCDGSFGCNSGGGLDFYGNPGVDSFYVLPDWESGTTCSVYEVFLPDGGIEVDDSDCQGIVVFPGEDSSCTIVNTRLYEGIPTLSQYGLALMALLMLGVGLIGFRRFV